MDSSSLSGTYPDASPFPAAVVFVEHLLAGSVAVSIGVIAIAGTGLLMLSGRIDVRRSARVILGCFVIFGAATIASGMEQWMFGCRDTSAHPETVQAPPPVSAETAQPRPGAYDPYAGAAVVAR